MTPIEHGRQKEPRKSDDRFHVQPNHRDVAVRRILPELTTLAEAGIVCENLYSGSLRRYRVEELLGGIFGGKVLGDGSHLHPKFLLKGGGERLQLRLDRSDDDEGMAMPRKFAREMLSDAAGGAGDEGGFDSRIADVIESVHANGGGAVVCRYCTPRRRRVPWWGASFKYPAGAALTPKVRSRFRLPLSASAHSNPSQSLEVSMSIEELRSLTYIIEKALESFRPYRVESLTPDETRLRLSLAAALRQANTALHEKNCALQKNARILRTQMALEIAVEASRQPRATKSAKAGP